VKISAIITASWRRPQLFDTLKVLRDCDPPPDEILLHVDGGNQVLVEEVRTAFPDIKVLESTKQIGPGGSRNRLLEAARNDWVASFDDDSHPFDPGFFATVGGVVNECPEASIIACQVFEPGEPVPPTEGACRRITDFVGCGCLYRREVFMKLAGYVPLPLAYGMEEVDLSLRYLDAGNVIVLGPRLRVIHNTDPANRNAPAAVAASIANIMLRAWLRYPGPLIPFGLIQAGHRALWLLSKGCHSGVMRGFWEIGTLLRKHAGLRKPVRAGSLFTYQFRRRFGWRT
jgi:GT2 family glycosyltransferase